MLASDGTSFCWGNVDGMIGRGRLDRTVLDQGFIAGEFDPAGIAIAGDDPYWTDPGNDRLGRAKLDGTEVDRDFITGASLPLDLAVGP
jgi:virginiamycin B lyase